jgi:hypothetical protein
MRAVKIQADKYGQAISLLLKMGGAFQTRFEDTLIVSPSQRRALEEAGFVAQNGAGEKPRKDHAKKAK